MKQILIVDGYNLINHDARYKRVKEADLERARVRLVEDLAAVATLSDYDVIIVFDAGGTSNKERQTATILGIEVCFTRSGESADSVIERLSYELSAGRPVVVATSDYAQQKVVFRPGVIIKSARQLSMEISEVLREAGRSYIESRGPNRRPRLEDRIDGTVKRVLDKLIRDF
ncbi:MAG: NYN domain-containing protein [Actinobacteria bacterium]|nr:NYN domain-containing protein [Actinomycetota bacterium]